MAKLAVDINSSHAVINIPQQECSFDRNTKNTAISPSSSFETDMPPQSLSQCQDVEKSMVADNPAAANNASTEEMNTHGNNHNVSKFIICAVGICTSFLSYGFLYEKLFKEIRRHEHENNGGDKIFITAFILTTQTVTNVVLAFVWKGVEKNLGATDKTSGKIKDVKHNEDEEKKQQQPPLNHRLIILASLFYCSAMSCTNESLNYVSYPTATLAKSSKLIPTMVMGYFVEKKVYSRKEWFGAMLITLGIVIFNFSRAKGTTSTSEHHDSPYGLSLLMASLLLDGLLGSCQGLIKKSTPINTTKTKKGKLHYYRPPTAIETMLYMNFYAFFFLLPVSIISGQFSTAVSFLSHSRYFQKSLLGLNLTATIGQVFIFFTIHWFSPVICTTITTSRKFMTILLSVWSFGHSLGFVEWICVLMVFGGIYYGIGEKLAIDKKAGGGGREKGE